MASESGLDRFKRAAQAVDVVVEPVHYPQGTRTAAEAAAAIPCDVSQIVKSLVLVAGDEVLLALTAGHNRVDLDRLGELVGCPVKMADAVKARDATGYSIGGTPPFGHPSNLTTYLDPSLLTHELVYGAAGAPDACFPIQPHRLLEVTGAEVADFVALNG